MTPAASISCRLWRVLLALGVLAFAGSSHVGAQQGEEPIAYVGHGTFFDSKGNQIALTPEFVARAQEWYRQKLLSNLNARKKSEFATFERQRDADVKAEGQARLLVQQHSLDWLVANSAEFKDHRMRGKLNALGYALKWKLPDRAGADQPQIREEFKLAPELENRLKQINFRPGGVTVLSATINSGQAYINECIAAGVPIPPPIGQLDPAGLAGWKTQGFIPIASQFIGQNQGPSPAEFRTFQSNSPVGMCVALPRYTDNSMTTVGLDGVICLGQVSSKVCFWDNQMNGNGFSFPAGTVIPIGVPNLTINPLGQYQAGGFELENGSGGVCTDCHAGQNPYIMHPKVDLGGGLKMEDLNRAPLNLPTFSATRYDPLVPASWPQNQLSMSPTYVPGACDSCHFDGGQGGALPHLSSDLPGYCGAIIGQAVQAGTPHTMPPQNPGGAAGDAGVIALQAFCGTAPSAGPSDRGDPHLTTTNGINYDFQAAGEFTALRNSATKFELQTRQTPVSTSFTPGANAYTGLASCVSLNTAAALRVGKHRITYQPARGTVGSPERLQLRIDGTLAALPANGINLGNGNMIARAASGGGIDVKTADGTRVIISPNYWTSEGYWYLNIEVLNTPAREGTMGHIAAGDWLPVAPDGKSFGPKPASLPDRHLLLNKKFADAWRVKTTTSLFDYAPGTSTDNFTNREWPPEAGGNCIAPDATRPPPKPMKPEVAQRLCRQIKDKAVFENCVLDLTAMGDAGVLQAYLRTLKAREAAAAK